MKKKIARTPVLVRSNLAGVHYGYLVWRKGRTVSLSRARRIWQWQGAKTLSNIAVSGVGKGSKVAPAVEAIVFDVCEVLYVLPAAAASLDAIEEWS